MKHFKRLMLALYAVFSTCGVPAAYAGVEFDCIYGPTPLEYGANPTLWSEFKLTPPELTNPLEFLDVTLTNTATFGVDTFGPVSETRTKPVPPPGSAWIFRNVFFAPPFTALWAMSSRAVWTNMLCFGSNCIPVVGQDLCTGEGYVSPAPGGGGGGGGGCAITDPATSALTLDGELLTVPAHQTGTALVTKRLAEDGRQVVADEYRLVAAEPGLRHTVLSVRHQRMHAANANYAPTPRVQLVARKISRARSLEGQRGFAVIEFGKSGGVLRVRTLGAASEAASARLQAEISKSVQTVFQDERRHDHTAYIAYEVRRGILRSMGSTLVTVPMCCICPGPLCHEG